MAEVGGKPFSEFKPMLADLAVAKLSPVSSEMARLMEQPAEIDAILGSVSSQFARSTDQGAVDKYGEQKKVVSQGRTSENAWCTTTARALRPSGMKLRPHLSSGASAGATTCPRRRPCSAASRT
mgnify:CR=1 FL=1